MNKRIFTLLALIFFISMVFSQSKFGISGGLNLSKTIVNEENPYETKVLPGALFGLTIISPIKANLSIRTEFLFSQKGVKLNENQDDFKYIGHQRINYFSIPVLGELRPGGENSIFSFVAGPYISIGLGGNYKIEEARNGTEEIFEGKVQFANEINSSNADDFDEGSTIVKRFDFGIDFGIGLNFNNFSINAIYELGATNIEPEITFFTSNELERFNRNVRISLTYFFNNN